ncbi:MAG: hypothetical protein RRZ84_00560 [Romboutsia sp.]
MIINIRKEVYNDYNMVETLTEETFKNEEFSDKSEHLLVNRLRKSNAFIKEF